MKISNNISFKSQTAFCKSTVARPVFNEFRKNTATQEPPKNLIMSTIAATGIVCTGAAVLFINKSKAAKIVKQVITSESPILNSLPKYINDLAVGLEKFIDKKIAPESLNCVMTKEELLSSLPKLTKENFVASEENIKNGIFKADLHTHSTFTDGKCDVKTILSQAAEYGDKLNALTNEKFIFALTDHDSVKGVIEALKIISENPDKYKNIKFVPGVELSYAHIAPKSQNPCEISEVLAYCVNPFSENIQNFFNNIYKQRSQMIDGFFKDLKQTFPDVSFSTEEMQKYYYLKMPEDTFIMNTYWRIKDYAQTKYAIARITKITGRNTDTAYKEVMAESPKNATLWNLICEEFAPRNVDENAQINEIRKKYSPSVTNGMVNAAAENTYEKIIETFSKEDEAFLALAHPYYLTEKINDVPNFIKNLISKSKGLLKASESYHQAYSNKISNDGIDWITKLTQNENLLNLGGRDNHEAAFLKI